MKNYIVFILLFILASTTLPNNLSAQSNCFYGCYDTTLNSKYYVYSDVANVRTLPDIDSEIRFKLSAGHEVMRISYKKTPDEVDGMSGYWYFIKTTDGTNREGWIWSETLSCIQLRRGNTKFVFGGMEKENENEYDCKLTIKVVENGKIVDRKNFKSYLEVTCYNAKIIDNVSLKNVKYVVHLTFDTHGCNEVGEDEFYFAWLDEKKKLVKLPEISSYSIESEDLHIPTKSNSGIPNLLVKIIANALESKYKGDNYNQEECEYEYKTELFKWDGEKVTKIDNKQ
jgi:hypothetical protein